MQVFTEPEQAGIQARPSACPNCGGKLESSFVAWAAGAAGYECKGCGHEVIVRFKSPFDNE